MRDKCKQSAVAPSLVADHRRGCELLEAFKARKSRKSPALLWAIERAIKKERVDVGEKAEIRERQKWPEQISYFAVRLFGLVAQSVQRCTCESGRLRALL